MARVKKQAGSRRLLKAVREAEALAGRPVVFRSLGRKRDGTIGFLVQGFHEQAGGAEHILLDDGLPAAAREATAAHELAHIVQTAEGFPRARVPPGKPYSKYGRLAERLSGLALDLHADRWALKRGFDVARALASSALPEVMQAMSTRPVKSESAYKSAHKRSADGTDTLLLAVDYASFRLRLGRSGIFGELDRLWTLRWPESRRLGQELARALARRRFGSASSCRRVMETALKLLKIPPEIIYVA